MSPSVTCYPMLSKARSREVLAAFAEGAKGALREGHPSSLSEGPAAFYGVIGLEHLLREAQYEEHEWFYGDNAFFDGHRHRFFRFGHNAFQLHSLARPDFARAKAQGISVKPWSGGGKHVVVVEQSDHYLQTVGMRMWMHRAISQLSRVTDRPLRIRRWNRNKAKLAATLANDLKGAWALVTHMSAAANEALLAGVPVFVSGLCAATPMASGELSNIESPKRPDGREEWAAGLAANQWTLEELRSGMAWRTLHGL